jgi:hypothetical protein
MLYKNTTEWSSSMATIADTGFERTAARISAAPEVCVATRNEPRASLRLQKEAVAFLSETLVADAVSFALNADGRSLRALSREAGLDHAFLSRLASGKNCTVSSLAKLSLALGKKLHISIE